MKQVFQLLCLIFFPFLSTAQLNMTLLDQLDYPDALNDIWGWVAPDGTEYAIVGVTTGVSIVSLEDPQNIQEVAWIPGPFSTWRDIKTWGHFAYVTTDQSGTNEGLLVIDLSSLPGSVSHSNWKPNLQGLGNLRTCHNLYIDEFGYCYLAGCNINEGGMLILDVFSLPGAPQFVAAAPAEYAHDVYVRDQLMYASEILAGQFSIYDVSDKLDIQYLGGKNTPFEFTHNAWLSGDGTVLFTTDERANAPIGSYYVADPTDIQELDQFRPAKTLGEGVIPHNVHVWNDYLIISYYTDGCIIVDAARPDNLVEVGNFDTFLGVQGGFDGAWGAYPFLPSGRVLVTDITNGLFVFDVNYVRGCYLEGTVANAQTGAALNEVKVEILSSEPNLAFTNFSGAYKGGQATPGEFEVKFTKAGFVPKIVSATLANGQVTALNVQLEPAPLYSGLVLREADGAPVPHAKIRFNGVEYEMELTSDAGGAFQAPLIPGAYTVVAGAWGYLPKSVEMTIPAAGPLTITLEKGYRDEFYFDFGWESTGTASAGFWEWAKPQQSVTSGNISTPGFDIDDDLGENCYVTGNGGNAGANDVDNGSVTLRSPVFDLSGYNEPVLTYYAYFFNGGGSGSAPNDHLSVRIHNGIQEVELALIDEPMNEWPAQSVINLKDFIQPTSNMRLSFTVTDNDPGHVAEGAVDVVEIYDANPLYVAETFPAAALLQAAPNPFAGDVSLSFHYHGQVEDAAVEVYDLLGRLQERVGIEQNTGVISAAGNLPAGTYIAVFTVKGRSLAQQKIVKIR